MEDKTTLICNAMSLLAMVVTENNAGVDLEKFVQDEFQLSQTDATDVVQHLNHLRNIIKGEQ